MHLDRNGDPLWSSEFGGPGEDKALAVAASSTAVYVSGVTSAAILGGTAAGGTDGWVAAFTPSGTPSWTRQIGSADDDLLSGVTVAPNGPAAPNDTVLLAGTLGSDAVVVAMSPTGQTEWQTSVGTPDADSGVGISAAADGTIALLGYTDGRFTALVGAHDVYAATLSAAGKLQATRQVRHRRRRRGRPVRRVEPVPQPGRAMGQRRDLRRHVHPQSRRR